MRHGSRKVKLGRRPDHQLALRRNLVFSFIKTGEIRTTLAKAKMVRPTIEKLITMAKHGIADEENRGRYEQTAISFFTSNQNSRNVVELTDKQRKARKRAKAAGQSYEMPAEEPRIVTRLFNEIAPLYLGRNGGYTRIHKIGPRLGDNAEMAILSLVRE